MVRWLFLSAAVASAAAGASAQTFSGLGPYPGGYGSPIVGSVSSSGQQVAGWASASDQSGTQAFRWTRAGGFDVLAPLAGATSAAATAFSRDGSVTYGYSVTADVWTVVRWRESGAESLFDGSGRVTQTSVDGSVLVGSIRPNGGGAQRAFRWTEAGGMVDLGVLPGRQAAQATSVSADGSIVVGQCTGISGASPIAFRWTSQTGMVSLGTLPGYTQSGAAGITADGSLIVGGCAGPSNSLGFRWTAQTGMVPIDPPAGWVSSGAIATSDDGQVIVGIGANGGAMLWTAALGAVGLRDYLVSAGIDMTGWQLSFAKSVSADGRVIVGPGVHNGVAEGWVVTLPRCGTADFNHDGDTGTDADIAAFFACLAGNCCGTCESVDFNDDGDVATDADIEAFFRVLGGGAC